MSAARTRFDNAQTALRHSTRVYRSKDAKLLCLPCTSFSLMATKAPLTFNDQSDLACLLSSAHVCMSESVTSTVNVGMQAKGELHLEVTYKPFEDDDTDSGYREAEAYALLLQQQAITDVKVSLK